MTCGVVTKYFFMKNILGHTAQTLQLNRKKPTGSKQTYNSLQRHSSGGNLDYDNVENCAPVLGSMGNSLGAGAGGSALASNGRCGRSRTLGDGLGKSNILWRYIGLNISRIWDKNISF